MVDAPRAVLVGLAIGAGTGAELADVFERAARAWADDYGTVVAFRRCPHHFRTFSTSLESTPAEADRVMREDADHYAAFLRSLQQDGCRVIFRTAFNAHALYHVRQALLGVKVDLLPTLDGEILLVRDATQGFYAGENVVDDDPDVIRRVCTFRRANTDRVLEFALAEVTARYGSPASLDRAIVACKFHVLGPQFAQWVADFARKTAVPFEVWQPDTTNRNLLKGHLRGRVLLVGANEWADVMHADLIARYGLGSQDEHCSRVVYLDDALRGLEELQTVHGSADDLAGKNLVNPVATLRAAALALERAGGCAGLGARLERAVLDAREARCATPDAGGTASAAEVVACILAAMRASAPSMAAR